ncbi:MAG: hypothetical protein MIO92_01210 [Methanosarcinaceae archaeon]|nr:hypothetical protein [Methanosarcinaceae archaeon]
MHEFPDSLHFLEPYMAGNNTIICGRYSTGQTQAMSDPCAIFDVFYLADEEASGRVGENVLRHGAANAASLFSG